MSTFLVVDEFYIIIVLFIQVVIAMAIPKLDLLLSLDGALFCSIFAILIPAILDIVMVWEEKKYCRIGFNLFIILVGTFSMLVGTYTSSVQIYDFFILGNK